MVLLGHSCCQWFYWAIAAVSGSIDIAAVLSISLLPYRARIEKDYGDNLVRLAKNSSGKDEIGCV